MTRLYQVYRNLHTGGWSIRCSKTRLVVARVESCFVANVRLHVSQKGVARAQREGVRNVHAWAIGELVETLPEGHQVRISYNPYRFPYRFHDESGAVIIGGSGAIFSENGSLSVINPTYETV